MLCEPDIPNKNNLMMIVASMYFSCLPSGVNIANDLIVSMKICCCFSYSFDVCY